MYSGGLTVGVVGQGALQQGHLVGDLLRPRPAPQPAERAARVLQPALSHQPVWTLRHEAERDNGADRRQDVDQRHRPPVQHRPQTAQKKKCHFT